MSIFKAKNYKKCILPKENFIDESWSSWRFRIRRRRTTATFGCSPKDRAEYGDFAAEGRRVCPPCSPKFEGFCRHHFLSNGYGKADGQLRPCIYISPPRQSKQNSQGPLRQRNENNRPVSRL